MFQANVEVKDWGDGNWVAQWGTAVFHQGSLFNYLTEKPIVSFGVLSGENFFTNLRVNLLDQYGAR